MGQKFPGREKRDPLAQPGGKMGPVPRDETGDPSRDGDRKKRFVVGIGEGFRKGGRRNRFPSDGDKVKQGIDLVRLETKLRPFQDVVVFGKDPGVETERRFAGGNHADDLAARPERGQQARHQDVRVEDDPQRRRFSRTALISASISPGEIVSVPCSTDRR